jgi:3-hydroxyacyl-CoA dehydrogenase / enoyl-CoA hydratase / 3-hydroxybutyryl-CoA epimerase
VMERIFAELQRSFPARFSATQICGQLAGAGLTGRKHGAASGFYVYGVGTETPNPQLARHAPAATHSPGAEVVQERLVRRMIAETRAALADGVVKTEDEAELALILGIGFPAYRGGLLHFARTQGW